MSTTSTSAKGYARIHRRDLGSIFFPSIFEADWIDRLIDDNRELVNLSP